MNTTARVIGIFSILKVLKLHEKTKELVETFNNIDIDLEQGSNCLVTLGVLVHAGEMDGVALKRTILLSQDLSITTNNVTSILLEQTH